ncbi:splicing factor U2af [Salix suchowensis]|nr:splicing factor U2af [Salix suchowensis]
MSRSSQLKEKHGRSSEMSQDHEGTAARTRPCRFDEIVSKRKNEKESKNMKEELNAISGGVTNEKASDHRSGRGNGHNEESLTGVRQHLSEEHGKASHRKKDDVSLKDDYVAKGKVRDVRDLESKSMAKMNSNMRTEVMKKTNEKIHDRRISEWPSNISKNEALKKHSREAEKDRDRHMDRSRRKTERESKEKYWNGVDDRGRDGSPAKKHNLGKGHHLETSERKERKEYNEELRLKSRRSRSREHEVRNRRSISLSPRAHKCGSYHRREHGELASHSVKERSGQQQSDVDKSKTKNSSSSSHYRGHGGSSCGLGGYSPRKRKTEATIKTTSPDKHSPERKCAKWDLAPEETNNVFPAATLSNFQSPNPTVSSNTHELASAVPITSTAVNPLSGVSHSASSTAAKVSIESIQLTQATCPMRMLYMENIPATASEKAVMECLNSLLISSSVNHIQGTQPCISCIMLKEKGQALVEFLTPEDASAALSFNGNSFSGSIIKVRRPKDFVEVATSELEKSTAVVDAISDIVKDSPHKIFVGGISKALSSKMLMEIASSFGPLKAYQSEISKDPGGPFAFLEYADQSVAFKACAGLNGMKLGGQVITVIQAVPNASSAEIDGNPPFCQIPQHAKALIGKPTEVLKLKNVFDSEKLSSMSNMEVEDVLEDVRLECARFGSVKSVNVVKYGAIPISNSELCEFNNDMASAKVTQSVDCDETNSKTRNIRELIDQIFMEGDSNGENKPGSDDAMEEPCQPDEVDDDMVVQDLVCKSLSDSQEPPQDELDSNVDNVADDDIQIEEVRGENKSTAGDVYNLEEVSGNKSTAGEELNLEQVSGDVEKPFLNGSTRTGPISIEKGDGKEHDCNRGRAFEPGCVFVEFRRAEASCMAAHCLHGRLFGDRVVVVEYVPLDLYLARFQK